MIFLLIALVLLISLLIMGGVFANPITRLLQQHWPNHVFEAEQFLLWGGLLLTAFVTGLLVMYLFLRP
jgi:uncharacterized membrane protein